LLSFRAGRKIPAMRRIVITLLALGMAACGSDEQDSTHRGDPYVDEPPLWNDYVLGFGETINLRESVGIEFVDVLEDSRCPSNLTCIQSGNARVLIRGLTPRGTFLVEVNTNLGLPQGALFDYYAVQLRKLEPYPVYNAQTGSAQIPDSEYEVTLFVTKAAEPP
jgi:hypothetical protein